MSNSVMKITCFGARGSIPAPSRRAYGALKEFVTTEFGGNTSCYLIEAGPFQIILDLGSGVLNCGDYLLANGKGVNAETIVLISHFHWDHIQGGPFAIPLYIPSNKFYFHGFAPVGRETTVPLNKALEDVLADQQAAPNFPVAHSAMPSRKEYFAHSFQHSETFQHEKDGEIVKITTIPLNHPNGCLGYRIEYKGKVAVYCTDNEPLLYLNKEIKKHAKDADWLLLDGQYTEEQLSGPTQTFGHGTPVDCVRQAIAANAKRCVIHHFDPRHDDATLRRMETNAKWAAENSPLSLGYQGIVEFAREGQVWEI